MSEKHEKRPDDKERDGAAVFADYARYYDLLYQDKDYEAECDLLEEVFRRFGKTKIKEILDLGCGTGNHVFPLASRGYQVTGVDRAEDMLSHARCKLTHFKNQSKSLPVFLQGDLRSLELGREFDAILMMFAVLGYQRTNEDVLAALKTVRRHLKPHGLFIADVWYGPAVLAIRPSDKIKTIPTQGGKVIRLASGNLDSYHHLVTVDYQVLHLKGHRLLTQSEEVHQMRYFFAQELGLFVAQCGMRFLGLRAFSNLECPPSEDTWSALLLSEAEPSHH